MSTFYLAPTPPPKSVDWPLSLWERTCFQLAMNYLKCGADMTVRKWICRYWQTVITEREPKIENSCEGFQLSPWEVVPKSVIRGGGVFPYISHVGICASKGVILAPFSSEKGHRLCPFYVWNRVWFSRELRECMNVFIVSIADELQRKRNILIRNGF